MIVVTEAFYCDRCGKGDETPTVPYLGWVFIDTFVQGTIGGADVKLHICPSCWRLTEQFIRGT